MPIGTLVHPLFGRVRFRTAHSRWVRGDQITFLSGFDAHDIRFVVIPQLVSVPGTHNDRLRFHQRAHEQVLMAFADIERLGLLHHIVACAGSLNSRLRKPTSEALSKLPSNHAFGIAIDLNSDDGSLGASVAPVAPVFEAFKFRWGKSFDDPMHFEVRSFIDHPRSVVRDVAVFLGEQSIDLGAKNLIGNLVCDASKASRLPGVTVVPSARSRMAFEGPGGARKLSVQHFGNELAFVSLPLLAGVAGLDLDFDNESKIVRLTNAAASNGEHTHG